MDLMPFKTLSGLTLIAAALASLVGHAAAADVLASERRPSYHSPSALASSPDGKTLYVADATAHSLAILNVEAPAQREVVPLRGNPRHLALSADGKLVYVAEHGAGTVAIVDTAQRKVTGRLAVGRWPTALAVAPKAGRLYVCNQDLHNVMTFDLAHQPPKLLAATPVVREPSCVAVAPDEQRVVVTNLLPNGPGTDPPLAAEVSMVDAVKLTQSATVKLPVGSSVVRGACISPDGRWAYVVHGLGRFHLPITQLERGWVNTFALSVIDLQKGARR